MDAFDAKVFVVTGGSRGIGRAVVERLIALNASVVATGRDTHHLDEVARALPADKLRTVVGDAADRSHQRATIALALAEFGRLDGLVANAGAHVSDGPILADDDDGFRRTLEVNVLAVRSWVREAARYWNEPGSGVVVAVSSVAGVRPEPGLGVYGTTKAAQSHLVAQLARELAPRVRVNAVAPGFTLTSTTAALGSQVIERIAGGYPMQRVATPNDIAGPIAFLLGPDSLMVTGQTLIVDGGFTMTVAPGYAG